MGEIKGEGQESWMRKVVGALPQEEVNPGM